MNLKKKKQLAARTLGVGVDKIIFVKPEEIKEAITKQDIRDLLGNKAIIIKQNKGKQMKQSNLRRGTGKIKKKIKKRKQEYVKLTRKLRAYIKQLLMQEKINKEKYRELRKQIKSKMFRSKSHLKESSLAKDKQDIKE